MEYVHYYQTQSEFNADYNGSGYTEPWVGYIEETSGTSYNKRPTPVTVNLYTYTGENVPYEQGFESFWDSTVTGSPVETIVFDSPEEFFEYHFVATSPLPGMGIFLGICAYEGDEFFNNMEGAYETGRVVYAGDYWASYICLNNYIASYDKQPVIDYLNEHGEINVVYAAWESGG